MKGRDLLEALNSMSEAALDSPVYVYSEYRRGTMEAAGVEISYTVKYEDPIEDYEIGSDEEFDEYELEGETPLPFIRVYN